MIAGPRRAGREKLLWGWRLLVAWMALAGLLQALEPHRAIHQYGHDRWTQQNGLPGSMVSDLRQLPGGYLWLCCGGRIYRFDGVQFTHFPLKAGGQSVDESLRAVGSGPQDQLLVRTATRTLALEGNAYVDLLPPFKIPDGFDRMVLAAKDGTLWLGSDNHIYRVRQGRPELIASGLGWTRTMMAQRDGSLWVGAGAALYRIKNEKLRVFPTTVMGSMVEHRLPPERPVTRQDVLPNYPSALMEDRDGVVWIGTYAGLWKFKNEVLFQDQDCEGLKGCPISALLRDRDGNVWAGTEGKGLWRLASGRWTSFTVLDGLSDDHVLSLREDQEGSLWVGTRTALERLRDAAMLTMTTRDGLSGDDVRSVLEGQDGSAWVFSYGGGITRWKGTSFRTYTTRDGLASNFTGNLFESRDGSIWLGTDHGLSRFRDGRWQTYTGDGKLLRVYISAMSEDERGLILACSDLNLYRFSEGKLTPYNLNLSADGKPAGVRYAFAILGDHEGTQWFALSGGLYRVARGQDPETASRTAFTDTPVCLCEDRQGYIWIVGSNTGGFARMRKSDGRLFQYPPGAGAALIGVGRLLCDLKGDVWVSTRTGILHFQRQELDDFAEGRCQSLHPTAYGVLDGLQNEDCAVVSSQHGGWLGADGRVYFVSRKGLVVFHPDRLPRNGLVPAVHIEDVQLDHQPSAFGAELVCPAGLENLAIHYSATSLRVPSRVRFKYRLEGFDPDWIQAGERRSAFYTRLPPGQYRFRVVACNDDGLWNEEGASLSLVLKPHFYQTRWFAGLALLFCTGAAFGIHIGRTRQLRRRHHELQGKVEAATRDLKHHQEHLEQMVEARTQELQNEVRERQKAEEYLRQSQKLESVGRLAGGVAHDFNNLLTVINGYSDMLIHEEPDAEGGREHLRECAQEIRSAGERASALTRQLLAFSRKQVLHPEIVDLNPLILDMQKMLGRLLPANVHLSVVPASSPCWVLVDPGQMGQIVMNLAVNARDAMPEGGTLIIETEEVDLDGQVLERHPFVPEGRYVRLSVTDTGVGMDEETQSKIFEPFFTTKEAGKGTGLGLATVFGIVKQSGGLIWVYSEVGKGTSFKIFFPVAQGAHEVLSPQPEPRPKPIQGATILVVEDQDSVRNLVVKTLVQSGYTVLEAPDAEGALRSAESFEGTLDLLFTDVVMPGMNGRELGTRMEALRPGIRVIYTSGYTETLMQDQGILEPGITLLQKPFSPKQLLKAVSDKLGSV